MCVADDVLVFCKVEKISIEYIKDALNELEAQTGLRVNGRAQKYKCKDSINSKFC